MIVIDSREKKFSHIEEYLKRNGVPYVFPQKMDVGDYCNTERPGIVIDRKADLQELCSNLSKGKNNHTRFVAECRRAFNQHLRFIVLIEGTNCKNAADVKEWKSKYSSHTGQWLAREMFRLTMAYGVEWEFCRKNETAKRILELLEYDS